MDLTISRPCLSAAAPVLQRIRLECETKLRPLYWRQLGVRPALAALPEPGGGLTISPGASIAFDTYFNAVFESQWRAHTSVGSLRLELQLRGQALLRVRRRSVPAGRSLVYEAVASGTVSVDVAPDGPNFRQAGLLWFELTAFDTPVTLLGGCWSAPGTAAAPTTLGVVICTFNREAELGAVLSAIATDAALEGAVARVIVVNQGRPGIRHLLAPATLRLGPRLKVVEQPNMGGAGGFGRGMLEALDDPTITHICVLDDDVRLEPESLLRMAAFFSLARGRVALGGHMLDKLQPMRLYEAGALVAANGALKPLQTNQDLTRAEVLDALLDPPATHYNGWWLFGFDKGLAQQLGLPLPCFIRGDDVEFGMRLHAASVPTVGLPGVGIWHEPFYLKIGGWQRYYEVRNALIAMALHQRFNPRHVALTAFKQAMTYLLTFQYGSAALVMRAVQDFCLGPALLERDPARIHAEVTALRRRYREEHTPSALVLAEARPRSPPHTRVGFVVEFARAIARNWLVATRPSQAPHRLHARDLVWFRVTDADDLAVDTYWDQELPTYRRDRALFRSLFWSALRATLSLYRAAPSLGAAWREAAPRLTSEAFWRSYLDMPTKQTPRALAHREERSAG